MDWAEHDAAVERYHSAQTRLVEYYNKKYCDVEFIDE